MDSGLADLCGDVVKVALNLSKEAGGLDAGALGERFDSLFREFEDRAQRANLPLAMVQLAKYALVAFVDQQVLTSELTIKDAWLENPLQMRYFDSSTAGEDFYNKLDELRQGNEPGRLEALEVFYLCLALGFSGKFSDTRGMEQRKILMDRLAREIGESRQGASGPLSPHGLEPAAAVVVVGKGWLRLPLWLPPLAAVVLLLVCWLVVSLLLSSAADGFNAVSPPKGGAP
jgi:type VI secretion system protein ImpK